MQDMNKESIPYREGKYPEMFEAAETKMMAKEDVVAYSDSLAKLRDNEISYRYAEARGEARGEQLGLKKGEELGLKKGEELGLKKGEARGLKKGKYEASLDIAKAMMKAGIPIEDIIKFTGLTETEIKY